jgi:hypothetical protein
MGRDTIETIQIEALRERLRPTLDGQFRKIQRWFSQTFSTPLIQVEEYPIEYVLLHYFEDRYGSLKDDELIEMARDLILEPQERALAEAQKELEDEEFAKLTEELAKMELANVKRASANILPKPAQNKQNESFTQELVIEHVDSLDLED